MMEGLASYEIFKTGFFMLIMICCFCCAIYLTIYNINLHYVSTPGNITLNADKLTETLVYTVNSKQYTQTITPTTSTSTVNNISTTTTRPTYSVGSCTVYYPSNTPESYSVNVNPTSMAEIFTGVTCCLSICMLLWFLFLRSNRDVAGVVGGIDAAETVGSFFFHR